LESGLFGHFGVELDADLPFLIVYDELLLLPMEATSLLIVFLI